MWRLKSQIQGGIYSVKPWHIIIWPNSSLQWMAIIALLRVKCLRCEDQKWEGGSERSDGQEIYESRWQLLCILYLGSCHLRHKIFSVSFKTRCILYLETQNSRKFWGIWIINILFAACDKQVESPLKYVKRKRRDWDRFMKAGAASGQVFPHCKTLKVVSFILKCWNMICLWNLLKENLPLKYVKRKEICR